MDTINNKKDIIKKIDDVIDDIVSKGKKPKFKDIVTSIGLTKMFLMRNMDISTYIVDKEQYYRINPPSKVKIDIPEEHINKIVKKLILEKREVSYENIAQELKVGVQKLYGVTVIKNAVSKNKIPRYMEKVNAMIPELKKTLQTMLEKDIHITVTAVADRIGTNNAYIYRHNELRDILNKYKNEQKRNGNKMIK